MSKSIAIVGSTGAVGQELIRLLETRNFPVASLRLFASARSAGQTVTFKGEQLVVEDLATADFHGIDIALFSAGGARSLEFVPQFVDAGAVVVDNSSAFRLDADVPLVIPEINPQDISSHKGIIANPNCSTIIASMALWPLHQAFQLTRFTVATYQAVSGAGAAAMDELHKQSTAIVADANAKVEPVIFPQQIGFNVIPQVDVFLDNDYSKEEMKFVTETAKIFHSDSIRISATCVRVPVFRAHAEAIHAEFAKPISVESARVALNAFSGVQVIDDLLAGQYPTPLIASEVDDVLVGRIRSDISSDNGLVLWVVGDQLLKGAALNAIQIAEALL